MAPNKIKRVIIAGAGFSAPANLPIQNRIIDKMTQLPQFDFLSGQLPQESLKFLHAYITVGLFLLDNYAQSDYHSLQNYYWQVRKQKEAFEIFKEATTQKAPQNVWEADIENLTDGPFSDKYIAEKLRDDYYAALYSIKDEIRLAIIKAHINVNLEDIFTAFDKSVNTREYLHEYAYTQMDDIRYSIMRLFTYYFSKGVQEHSFLQSEYLNFFKYIQRHRTVSPTTIITTNWDTLIEEYCNRLKISYSYGLQESYTSSTSSNLNNNAYQLLLLKIHGSTNWLRCLHCGSISIFEKNKAAASLFSDETQELCAICNGGGTSFEPSLQPEIITPTMVKSFSSQIYSNLWGTAGRELLNATHVIFVGYSLPIADFDFRYLLQRCIPHTAVIDVILTHSSDPAQTGIESFQSLLPEKRYRDAFPKNKIQFFYDGFGEYFH